MNAAQDRSEPNVKFGVDANEWNWNRKAKMEKKEDNGEGAKLPTKKKIPNSAPILPSERVSQGKV
jgi:hypothetical protein